MGGRAAPCEKVVEVMSNDLALRGLTKELAVKIIVEGRERGLSWGAVVRSLGAAVDLRTCQRWLAEVSEAEAEAERPISTIIAFTGPRGSGKTLAMTAFAVEEADAGRPVFYWPADLRLTFGTPVTLIDLIDMGESLRGGVICLDEAHLSFNKYRGGTTASIQLMRVVSQVRKLGLDLLYSTNSIEEVQMSLQYQTDFHARCKSYLPPDYPDADCIVLRWTDTQGRYGRGEPRGNAFGKPDTRIRWAEKLYPASATFPLFNTDSVASLEALDMSSDMLREHRAQLALGEGYGAFRDYLASVYIPFALREGATIVNTAVLTAFLAATPAGESGWDGGPVSADLVGKALKELGLRKRGAGFALPKAKLWGTGAA